MLDRYLKILAESLEKKSTVLGQIEELSRKQSELIVANASLEDIGANMEEKDKLITELIKLDDGFDAMYENIKSELLTHKDEYAEQIRVIQNLIGKVMEKSAMIEAVEARNKASMDLRFSNERKALNQKRSASTAAYDYYKVSSKLTAVTPQFLDKKK